MLNEYQEEAYVFKCRNSTSY